MGERLFIKKIKHFHIKPYNGLTRYSGFWLEYNCLQRLNNNFHCICKRRCPSHFPIIKDYNNYKKKFLLSYCGQSLDKKKRKIKNIEEQLDCILYNLKRNNIIHLDILPKNICTNNRGIVFLIDFDIAIYNNIILSPKINQRWTEYKRSRKYYSKKVKEEILQNFRDSGGKAP